MVVSSLSGLSHMLNFDVKFRVSEQRFTISEKGQNTSSVVQSDDQTPVLQSNHMLQVHFNIYLKRECSL